MTDQNEKHAGWRHLLEQISSSSAFKSADYAKAVSDLLNGRADEILATSVGEGDPYLLFRTDFATDVFSWLQQERKAVSTPEPAGFLNNVPTDSLIEFSCELRDIEEAIDRWFTALQLKPLKWSEGQPENPIRIGWVYNVEAFRSAILRYRRQHRFLHGA